jgi:hypothetical protein
MLILPMNEYADSALLTIMNGAAGLVKICRQEVDTTPELSTLSRCNSLNHCVVGIEKSLKELLLAL